MSGAELARQKDRRRTRYAAAAVSALLLMNGLALALGPSAPAQALARLEVLKPAVEVGAGDGATLASVSSVTDLAAGARIRTSPRGIAEISFADGSMTRLGPDTTYSLQTLKVGADGRQIIGRLDVGRSFHRVSKVTGSQSRFEVQTSKAIAAVRGTAFHVQCLVADVCEVAVVEGTVAVTTPDGRTVDVTAGRRVVVGRDGTLGALEALSPSDAWVEMNAEIDEQRSDSPANAPADSPASSTPGTSPPDPDTLAEADSSPSSIAPASSNATTPGPLSSTTFPPRVSGSTRTDGGSPTTATGGANSSTPPPTGGTTTSPPSTPPLTWPTEPTAPVGTTLPVEPLPVCPGDQGDPKRAAVGALDGEVSDCLPCDVGGTQPNNPNCARED